MFPTKRYKTTILTVFLSFCLIIQNTYTTENHVAAEEHPNTLFTDKELLELALYDSEVTDTEKTSTVDGKLKKPKKSRKRKTEDSTGSRVKKIALFSVLALLSLVGIVAYQRIRPLSQKVDNAVKDIDGEDSGSDGSGDSENSDKDSDNIFDNTNRHEDMNDFMRNHTVVPQQRQDPYNPPLAPPFILTRDPERLECSICYENFDTGGRDGLVYLTSLCQCKHIILCNLCIEAERKQNQVSCAGCRQPAEYKAYTEDQYKIKNAIDLTTEAICHCCGFKLFAENTFDREVPIKSECCNTVVHTRCLNDIVINRLSNDDNNENSCPFCNCKENYQTVSLGFGEGE